MENLIEKKWKQAMTHTEYMELMNRLVQEGKTTGTNQSEAYVKHTKMAAQRINKWNKIFNLTSEDKIAITKKNNMGWLIIVEAWCGDVGQNLSALKKIADEAKIEVRLILRDDHLDLMDEFLTNGGRSIPKLIAIDLDNYSVKWEWGPRPKLLQEWYLKEKSKESFEYAKVSEEMHLWYAKNKHQELTKEFIELLAQS